MAAVATRNNNNSPLPHARLSSPKDTKRVTVVKPEESRKETNAHAAEDAPANAPARLADSAQPVQPPETTAAPAESKAATTAAAAPPQKGKPLGPPPRPNNSTEPDYFNQIHNQPIANPYQQEPNPFESQFGNPASETPGKTLLPPVASLTSPSALIPSGTPGWGSLRSGPLSPAMLAGPTGNNDYFGDAPFSRGFPTPNESSLRTGLTPGGGGSMFPAPSPNTQALFNSLQTNGAATPGTLDFMRTVNRASQANPGNNFTGPTSQPADSNNATANMERTQQPTTADPFAHPDADAANGLYMLAQANGLRSQYAQQSQPAPVQTNNARATGTQSQSTSPVTKSANRNSIGNASAGTGDSESDMKPATRNTKSAKKGAASNGRRKADDTPAKAPANKRAKANSGKVVEMEPEDEDDDDEDGFPDGDETKDGRKMTDEEKRKNFLERNRVAALKCRQRKKQWLANLQAKVELFSSENDALSQTVTQLREEIVNLKTLLLAHKDCPVSAAQGLQSATMHAYLNETGGPQNHHANPYGMAPGPGMQMSMAAGQMAGGMQRR